MNLDEQIELMERAIGWQPSTRLRQSVLASLLELKRLREAVDALIDAYAHEGPIVAAQRYSDLVAVRQGGGE